MKANYRQNRDKLESDRETGNTPADRALGPGAPSESQVKDLFLEQTMQTIQTKRQAELQAELQAERQTEEVLRILARSMADDLMMNFTLTEIRAGRHLRFHTKKRIPDTRQ